MVSNVTMIVSFLDMQWCWALLSYILCRRIMFRGYLYYFKLQSLILWVIKKHNHFQWAEFNLTCCILSPMSSFVGKFSYFARLLIDDFLPISLSLTCSFPSPGIRRKYDMWCFRDCVAGKNVKYLCLWFWRCFGWSTGDVSNRDHLMEKTL